MKKSIVFIGMIFMLLLGTTVVLASAEGVVVKATVENNRIYVGDKTKVGFTAVFSDPNEPIYNLTLDSYNFADGGVIKFNSDCFKVSYSSDNSKIAAVDDKGVVTGISAGSATITQRIEFNIESYEGGPLVNEHYAKYTYAHSCEGNEGNGNSQVLDKHARDTFTREVTVTVVPDDRLYLCQPGKEPVPVKMTMNTASHEIDRLCVGAATNMDFYVTMTELNDPTVKYSLNKVGFYSGAFLDPENLTVNYSSDNERVATVNKQGMVTGVSEGWANITVNLIVKPESLDEGGLKAKIRKGRLAVKASGTARPITFTRQVSVLIQPSPVMNNVILAQSESRQLTVAAPPGFDKDLLGFENGNCMIRDPSIAKVGSKTGIITGLRPGRTYAVYFRKKKWDSNIYLPIASSVTVYPVMAIHPESINVYIGTPKTLKVTFDSWYSGEKTGTWSVADESVASIDQSGKVTGKKTGTTIATFTINATGAQTDCTVVVAESPFRITPDPLRIYNGDTERLTVTFDSSYSGEKNGTWSVADSTIVSVEESNTAPITINAKHTIPGTIGAKVTGKKPGTTTVTFTNTATGARQDCTVTVKPAFTIAPDPLTVYTSETGGLTVTFDDGYNGSRDGRWSVNDNTVVSIDQNGVVTGKKAGTAIAAYTVDPTPVVTGVQNKNPVNIETAAVKSAYNIVRTVSVVVKPGSFTVTFDPNGGSPQPESVTVRHDTTVARPADPSISDKLFLGWYTAPLVQSGNGIYLTNIKIGKQWDFANDKVTEDMTLYAWWGLKTVSSGGSSRHRQLPSWPYITGPDTVNLLEGYDNYDQAYTFGGYPAPTYGISDTEPNTAGATFSGNTLTIPQGLGAGSYVVTLTATNSEGTVTKTITVNVNPAETPPTITGPDTINLTEGYDSTHQDYAYTFGGYPVPTCGISTDKPNTANATLTGNTLTIPAGLGVGSYEVTLYATNSAGTATKTVTVNVSLATTMPTITGPATIDLTEGYASIDQAYTFGGYPAPTCGISTDKPNTANAILTGNTLTIPAGLGVGSYEVTLYAANSAGTATKTVTVNVSPAATMPTITGPATIDLTEGYASIDQAYTFGGYPVPTCGISTDKPNTANAALAGNTLTIPAGLGAGSYVVTLYATNSVGTVTKTVTVNVSPAATLPTITGPATIDLTEGYASIDQAYTFGGYPAPTCGISTDKPNTANAALAGNTLTIPAGLGAGSYVVTLYATNSAGTATKTVTVNVIPAATLPTIAGPDTINLTEGYASSDQAYTFGGYPAPTCGISTDKPNTANAAFAGTTLTIPAGLGAGSYVVTLYATNWAGTATKTVTVNVSPAATLPTITGPATILLPPPYTSDNYPYTVTGSPTTYQITNISSSPGFFSFDGVNLSITSGLDCNDSPFTLTLTATNSAGTATKDVTVYVIMMDPTSLGVDEGDTQNQALSVTGAGSSYTLSLQNAPAWVSLSGNTLTVSPPAGTLTGGSPEDFTVDIVITVPGGETYTTPIYITVNP